MHVYSAFLHDPMIVRLPRLLGLVVESGRGVMLIDS